MGFLYQDTKYFTILRRYNGVISRYEKKLNRNKEIICLACEIIGRYVQTLSHYNEIWRNHKTYITRLCAICYSLIRPKLSCMNEKLSGFKEKLSHFDDIICRIARYLVVITSY